MKLNTMNDVRRLYVVEEQPTGRAWAARSLRDVLDWRTTGTPLRVAVWNRNGDSWVRDSEFEV